MFKHLLLPTDGSSLSNDAIEKGIQFASDAQAQVTGIYVMPEFHTMIFRTEMLEDTEPQFAAVPSSTGCRYPIRQPLQRSR